RRCSCRCNWISCFDYGIRHLDYDVTRTGRLWLWIGCGLPYLDGSRTDSLSGVPDLRKVQERQSRAGVVELLVGCLGAYVFMRLRCVPEAGDCFTAYCSAFSSIPGFSVSDSA